MRPVILCALLLAPLAAAGQTSAGNMPPDFYPKPSCEKPQSPGKPFDAQDQMTQLAYNAKVRKFNSQAVAFNTCMKDYNDRAQNDINAILATVHAAVAAANAPEP